MTRTTLPPLLLELQASSTPDAQLSALKRVKNELIGNDLKKTSWIAQGLIPILSRFVSSDAAQNTRRSSRKPGGTSKGRYEASALPHEDSSFLQAVVIIGLLAQGRVSLTQHSCGR